MQAMLDHEDRHWWYRGRRRIVSQELERLRQRIPQDARVLDAGCGSGRLLDDLARCGRVSGLDMNPDAVALARARGYDDVHAGRVEELPWPDATFNLVTSLDVIEHTPDDRVTLAELRRVTKPRAALLLTVPALQALWSAHDVANQHYRRYDRRMLRALAADSGFAIERMTYFNSLLLAPAAAVRVLRRLRDPTLQGGHRSELELTPDRLSPLLELPLRIEAGWLRDGRRTLPLGLSLLAVLRRS